MNFDTRNLARAWATLALSAVLGLGLIACGGGGGSSDEDQITDLISNAIGNTDETLCTEAFTQNFTETISGEKGDKAIKDCESALKQDTSDNSGVKVTDIKVDGDTATAKATFTNTDNGSDSATFDLAKEDGNWKIDSTGGSS